MVNETSNTWLNSLRDAGSDATGWGCLVHSYGPFIRGILLQRGIQPDVADDISQNVMAVVLRRLRNFERERTGSFRAWLRSITVNCLRDFQKTKRYAPLASDAFADLIQSMGDPRSELTRVWNQQHARHTLEMLLASVAPDFAFKTMEAFRRLAIDEEPTAQVALELGMSRNACVIARSRVLKALRQRFEELFGEDDGLRELFS